MGVTLWTALVFWLASSYIEYKIVKNWPVTRKLIHHPVGGIILSVLIGFLVGMAIGSAGGLGIFIGQILGLATNNFTFQLYSAMAQLNTASRQFIADSKVFVQKNKDAALTIVQSIKTIFHAIHMILKVVFWPFKMLNRALNKVAPS